MKKTPAKKTWIFDITYLSRSLVINGNASVVGSYSRVDEPLEMVRLALAGARGKSGNLRVTLVAES